MQSDHSGANLFLDRRPSSRVQKQQPQMIQIEQIQNPKSLLARRIKPNELEASYEFHTYGINAGAGTHVQHYPH